MFALTLSRVGFYKKQVPRRIFLYKNPGSITIEPNFWKEVGYDALRDYRLFCEPVSRFQCFSPTMRRLSQEDHTSYRLRLAIEPAQQ
jgi:hypothetical protein